MAWNPTNSIFAIRIKAKSKSLTLCKDQLPSCLRWETAISYSFHRHEFCFPICQLGLIYFALHNWFFPPVAMLDYFIFFTYEHNFVSYCYFLLTNSISVSPVSFIVIISSLVNYCRGEVCACSNLFVYCKNRITVDWRLFLILFSTLNKFHCFFFIIQSCFFRQGLYFNNFILKKAN